MNGAEAEQKTNDETHVGRLIDDHFEIRCWEL